MKFKILSTQILLFTLLLISYSLACQDSETRGSLFAKHKYDGKEIPIFEEEKHKLPSPILTENSEWINMYWKCWEIAFKHFKKPPKNSPFVSNILDEAFNKNIFQWDMIFMVMFARYGNDIFLAVNSLDNFYCRQHESGYICREISEYDGSDFVYISRSNTINPPLFSWAEIASFNNTGDTSRFELVMPVLEKYIEWLNKYGDPNISSRDKNWETHGRKALNSTHELYWNTPLGSGMDNTPRGGNGWVDMSCQMVIQYNNLARMSEVTGDKAKVIYFKSEVRKIALRINKFCWNEEDGLYYDIDNEGHHIKWKTSGCFWPMLANIASEEQAKRLVEHLKDTNLFWRKNVFPTLAADQVGYNPAGGYWLGSIWAPTNYAIIKGLEQNGFKDIAREASKRYLSQMQCVFDSTGTIWENYSPDYCAPGDQSRPDFVGWSGIGPIALLIENVLGFSVSAADNTLIWNISRTDKHGIKNLKIGKINVDIICNERNSLETPVEIEIITDGKLNLKVQLNEKEKMFSLDPGFHEIIID